MKISNLVLILISLYLCMKVSHNIIYRLRSTRKRQLSHLMGQITDHVEMVEQD